MRSITSFEDSWWDTTVNGPAPTGLILNSSGPAALSAVGETIQLTFDAGNELSTLAYGRVKRSTTVRLPSVVMPFSASGHRGAHVHGEETSRVKLRPRPPRRTGCRR